MDVVLGFDPGGKDGFGWCILEDADKPPLRVIATGVADNAATSLAAVLEHIPRDVSVLAAGIDAPMFWGTEGDRAVDQIVRADIRARGARTPGGTVQAVNSLRGACLSQGVMIAALLRRCWPDLPVTEAHPKAYLWTIGAATPDTYPQSILLHALREFSCPNTETIEHERDAAITAYCAWAMVHRAVGWRDLLREEPDPYLPVAHPVSYWYPLLNATAQQSIASDELLTIFTPHS